VGDKELTSDRIKVVTDFKTDDSVMGLVNCEVATEGFDYPNIGCVILARPTKSKTIYLQSLGRGLRLKDDEFVAKFAQECIILDVVDNTSKHRLINTITLDKDVPVEKKLFISEEHRQMLLDVKFAREHKFIVTQKDNDVKIDLLQLPKVKISKSIRMQEPATEKQLGIIKRLDYDIENIHYTKAMCSEIIGALPVGKAKLAALKANGYDISDGATLAEYGMAKKELEKRGIIIE